MRKPASVMFSCKNTLPKETTTDDDDDDDDDEDNDDEDELFCSDLFTDTEILFPASNNSGYCDSGMAIWFFVKCRIMFLRKIS